MIIKKQHDNHIHIYSDKGKKILQVQTGRKYSEAMEDIKGVHYDYIEVEE